MDGRLENRPSQFPFVFVTDDSVKALPVISDSLFDAVAQGVRFQVNKSDLQPSDSFVALYREQLVPWLKSQGLQLRRVFVKGAASPEGPYQNNVRLSKARTQQLVGFLLTELGQRMNGENPIEAESITEDYGLLVKMMRRAKDPYYKKVRAIWLRSQGDEERCKLQLMALEKGRVWRRLIHTYFPYLRQSRVVLWFVRPVKKTIPEEPVADAEAEAEADTIAVTDSIESTDTLTLPSYSSYSRRHLIAIRTNLIHDLLYVPQFGFAYGGNIQLEYYPLRGHYTLNAGFTFTNHRHWDSHKFFQIRDLQLELRRYFKGQGQFVGTFLDAYLQGMKYGIGFSETKGWQGEGGGAGVGIGHTWPLTKRGNLRLEVSATVGFFITRYDPYVWGENNADEGRGLYYYDYRGNVADFKERNHRFVWVGPTNAGLHITYDIIYRKKQKEAAR